MNCLSFRRAAICFAAASFFILLPLLQASDGGSSANAVDTSSTPPPAVASILINPNAATAPISDSFIGFSLILSETQFMVGTSVSNMNPMFEQLIRNITQYQTMPMQLRELSDKVYTSQTSASLPALAQLSANTGVKYFIGVDLVDGDPSIAASQTSTVLSSIPASNVLEWELGNEPDLYVSNKQKTSDNWNYSIYLDQYQNQFAPAILTAGEGIKLSAPVLAGFATSWLGGLNTFVTNHTSTLGMVNLHYYPGSACSGHTENSDFLLSESAITNRNTAPDNMTGYVANMRAAGLNNLRIGEMNSIACGGQDGVSNSFSSALWALDVGMRFANAGVTGINFFTSSSNTSYYSPFNFVRSGSFPNTQYLSPKVNPLYYGILMLAETLQNHGALLPASVTSDSQSIKAWAVRDTCGTIRLLLINKDQNVGGNINVTLSGRGLATTTHLTALNFQSKSGVTLAGQTFDGSPDGTIQGTYMVDTVSPDNGVYSVNVPSVSAELLTVPSANEVEVEHFSCRK